MKTGTHLRMFTAFPALNVLNLRFDSHKTNKYKYSFQTIQCKYTSKQYSILLQSFLKCRVLSLASFRSISLQIFANITMGTACLLNLVTIHGKIVT